MYANGDKYYGDLTDCEPDGRGIMHYENGDVYNGKVWLLFAVVSTECVVSYNFVWWNGFCGHSGGKDTNTVAVRSNTRPDLSVTRAG